jgi:hypothetical protein
VTLNDKFATSYWTISQNPTGWLLSSSEVLLDKIFLKCRPGCITCKC